MISAKKQYQPKTTTASSAQEELADCVVTEAQAWCNFVLFQMIYLPVGFTIIKHQLRKESQSSQSSFRFLLENKKNNQQIAIKQFLYDWAPPAYDYPCLWLNTAKFSSANILAPRPVLAANRVLWIGKNYRGQNAATIDLERTRVEITFDGINLTDEELINIVQALKLCDETLREKILNTSFAYLFYYARHKKNASEVPLCYWKQTRLDTCYGIVLSLEGEINTNGLSPHIISVLNSHGYYLNGVFGITTPATLSAVPLAKRDEMAEKEYLFEHHQYPGVFIHILATPSTSVHPIKYPPSIGDQVCEHEVLNALENENYLANSNQKYGNYELIWKSKEMTYLMIIRAVPWVSYDWAMNLCELLSPKGGELQGSSEPAQIKFPLFVSYILLALLYFGWSPA